MKEIHTMELKMFLRKFNFSYLFNKKMSNFTAAKESITNDD